jgi:hypothetical protein
MNGNYNQNLLKSYCVTFYRATVQNCVTKSLRGPQDLFRGPMRSKPFESPDVVCTLRIPVFRRLNQEDQQLEASLG